MVGRLGLEPRTCGLRVRCSTIELTAHTGKLGWIMGFEPTTLGTTIRCSNQLSYIHHCNNYYSGGAPDRTRTCNPRLRRPVLYPVELQAPKPGTGWSG